MRGWNPPNRPKYRNRRCLACRSCGLMVEKAGGNAARMTDWHTPGNLDHYCDGEIVQFDAKGEARTWLALCDAEDRGWIEDLERQPKFEIRVEGGVKVGVYRADFRFTHRGVVRVVDSKGMRTPLYKFKKKAVEGMYGVVIEEWKPGGTAL